MSFVFVPALFLWATGLASSRRRGGVSVSGSVSLLPHLARRLGAAAAFFSGIAVFHATPMRASTLLGKIEIAVVLALLTLDVFTPDQP